MLRQSTYIQIDLGLRQAVSVWRAQHCEIRCLSGTLWITEENGGRDIVLRSGECYPLTHRGHTVIESLGKQQGACCQLRRERSPNSILKRLRGWAAAWMTGSPVLRPARPERPATPF